MEFFEICGIKDTETDLNIICIYRNPMDKHFSAFLKQLEKVLEHYFNKKCIVTGDFNIDLLTDSIQRSEFLSLLKCYNFRPLITAVTYVRGNSQSGLDNFLTNLPDDCIDDIHIDFNGLSDGHAALFCNVNLPSEGNNNNTKPDKVILRKCRMFNERNNNVFTENILKFNWTKCGINSFLNYLNNIFANSYEEKLKKVKKCNQNLAWVTKGIRTSSKMKRILISGHGAQNDLTIINYKTRYIRVYRQVIRAAKKLAVQSAIERSKNSAKAIWGTVSKYRKQSYNTNKRTITLKDNEVYIENPQYIVDAFAEKFHNKDYHSVGDSALSMEFLLQSVQPFSGNFIWDDITPIEIVKIIKNMDDKKSCGWDDIPISIFKKNIDLWAIPLATFFNKCYEQEVFPDQLKIAKVLPVYKKGCRTNIKNYRPISLLPTISKIFERVIKVRLVRHLQENNILSKRQFGYQTNIGTNDAMEALIDDVTTNLNNHRKVAGLFLDLSSAFDMVDHQIIIQKLNHYGINGKVLKLLDSYLNNRYQYVEIKRVVDNKELSFKSKLKKVERGVPQGSILGPILFILFVNDMIPFMYSSIPNIKLTVFADDTNAVINAHSIVDLNTQVNKALIAFSRWFTANNLKLNAEKTGAILFKPTTRKTDLLNIKLNNECIALVHSVKFLGIHIDEVLNWKEELKHIESKISSACFALRSLRDELTIKQLKIVYHALVESRLRYSIRFWGNSYDYNLKKAFIAQKRAIRTIVRISQTQSCREYFKKLNILTAPCLYILVLLTDHVKNLDKYENTLERKTRHDTRRRDLANLIHPKLQIVKHSVKYQAVRLFNKLPNHLKIITNIKLFKISLRAYLLENSFYSVEDYVNNLNL